MTELNGMANAFEPFYFRKFINVSFVIKEGYIVTTKYKYQIIMDGIIGRSSNDPPMISTKFCAAQLSAYDQRNHVSQRY